MCFSAAGGFGLVVDKKFAAMLQKSSLSRQVGDNPLEEVIDFSAEDEATLKELSGEGEGGSSVLAFFSLGDFEVPGTYVFSFGGANHHSKKIRSRATIILYSEKIVTNARRKGRE